MGASINNKFFGPTDQDGPQLVLVGRIVGQADGENCIILKQRAKRRFRVRGETSGAVGNVTFVDKDDVNDLNEGECFLLGLQRDMTTQRPIWALKQNTVTYYDATADQQPLDYLFREIWFPTPPATTHTTFFPADQVDGSEGGSGGGGNGGGGNGGGGGNTPPGDVPPSGTDAAYAAAASGARGILDTPGMVSGQNTPDARSGGSDVGQIYTSTYILGNGIDNIVSITATQTARNWDNANPITTPMSVPSVRWTVRSTANIMRERNLTDYNGNMEFNTDGAYTNQELLNVWGNGVGIPYVNTCTWIFDQLDVFFYAQDTHPTDPAPVTGQVAVWGFHNQNDTPYLEGSIATSSAGATTGQVSRQETIRVPVASIADSSATMDVTFANAVSGDNTPADNANFLDIKASVENVEWHAGSMAGTMARATNLGTDLDLTDVSIGEFLESAGVDLAAVQANDVYQLAMYADSSLAEVDYKLCMTVRINVIA